MNHLRALFSESPARDKAVSRKQFFTSAPTSPAISIQSSRLGGSAGRPLELIACFLRAFIDGSAGAGRMMQIGKDPLYFGRSSSATDRLTNPGRCQSSLNSLSPRSGGRNVEQMTAEHEARKKTNERQRAATHVAATNGGFRESSWNIGRSSGCSRIAAWSLVDTIQVLFCC
jgi:hypothetical protein